MALRSLLVRRMPALGLRPSPIGPRMGPVRALSPAAGSRLMSHGSPTINPAGDSQDEIAKLRKAVNVLVTECDKLDAELEKCWADRHKALKMMEQARAAAQASYNEANRNRTEARKRFMETLKNVDIGCDIVLFSCPLLIILMTITM